MGPTDPPPAPAPTARGDAPAILHALARRDAADTGDEHFSRAEVTDRWLAQSFRPDRDSVVVWRDGAVAGYAAVFGVGALAFVTPGYEGRGIGRALLAWCERRARELGHPVLRQRTAAANALAAALLLGAGYRVVRTVWGLVHTLDSLPPLCEPPTGVRLRAIDRTTDAVALHAADERGFAENADYSPETLGNFRAEHLDVATLDPRASRVAERDGTLAGFLIADIRHGDVGHVDLLAVMPEERGRGLGTALLVHALHVFARDGRRGATLEVASDNPRALRIYEAAGMTRRLGAAIWEKPVAAVD